ncbi:Helix-turn-helix domain-containing protein [Loktanella salsilacus]|uniref:Helix-turn-helix domain-containing protein n=1 Tax=Loktanella salsilacus TaxID=195913 RepID=A0A1I4IXA2_9RHOB|nr:helix-turn-helix transcriptional regulator [Loktanella salsilacus]SFL58613.1 Helix-turn-helix domain-containing protein [Loktanella salsilacus]
MDHLFQLSQMQSIILPITIKIPNATVDSLARDSGLAWKTTRLVLKGQGTIASLDRLRVALKLKWSWTPLDQGVAPGAALAARRQAKGLSQRAMATRLEISPQTIVTLETRFAGRIDTLRRYLRILRINDVLIVPSKRLVPGQNDAAADVVYTPRDLAYKIQQTFASEIRGSVLDPARGDGAFYNAFPEWVDKHWCEASEGQDFFDWSTPVDWIVTNPPWSIFRDFLTHSLRIADNILFLAPLTHYTTKSRVKLIADAGFAVKRIVMVPTPADWPASGFQLAAVWLQKGWKGPAKFETM